MFSKILIISAFLFFISSVSVFGATVDFTCSEYNYPWCGTETLGGSSGLVSKLYNYSLALVGVTALGAIIYGGILYTVSSGNASKQSEAVSWITGAVWGIVLLIGASLLLRTINPEILQLREPEFVKPVIKTATNSTTETSNQSTVSTCSRGTGVCSITQKSMTYKSCQSWAESIKGQNNLTELPTITFSDQQTDGTGICKLVYTKK